MIIFEILYLFTAGLPAPYGANSLPLTLPYWQNQPRITPQANSSTSKYINRVSQGLSWLVPWMTLYAAGYGYVAGLAFMQSWQMHRARLQIEDQGTVQ